MMVYVVSPQRGRSSIPPGPAGFKRGATNEVERIARISASRVDQKQHDDASRIFEG
jgi:hypothetical protein